MYEKRLASLPQIKFQEKGLLFPLFPRCPQASVVSLHDRLKTMADNDVAPSYGEAGAVPQEEVVGSTTQENGQLDEGEATHDNVVAENDKNAEGGETSPSKLAKVEEESHEDAAVAPDTKDDEKVVDTPAESNDAIHEQPTANVVEEDKQVREAGAVVPEVVHDKEDNKPQEEEEKMTTAAYEVEQHEESEAEAKASHSSGVVSEEKAVESTEVERVTTAVNEEVKQQGETVDSVTVVHTATHEEGTHHEEKSEKIEAEAVPSDSTAETQREKGKEKEKDVPAVEHTASAPKKLPKATPEVLAHLHRLNFEVASSDGTDVA